MNKCAKCGGERKEEEQELFNKMHGIEMGVCNTCWDGEFKLEREIKESEKHDSSC